MTEAKGCLVCGSGNTQTVDGVCGRRCAAHPPQFRPHHAVDLARSLGMPAALVYIRTPMPGEA